MKPFFSLLLAVCVVLTAGAALAKDKKRRDLEEIGNRDVGRGINFYSIEKEIALGRQLAQEVQRQAKMADDPIIGEYINRLGQNLVRNSDAKIPFTFQIVDAQQFNAFALPGGFICVNSGLIRATESESELAGALAHEIAHVTARHMTRQATRSRIAEYATLPMVLLGGWGGYAARQAAGLMIPMSYLSFSRAFESEADMYGLQYMYKAGYDPTASIDLFERMLTLEIRRPGTIAKVFQSHPMTEDRIRKTQRDIAETLPDRQEFVVTTSEFNEMRARTVELYFYRKREEKDPGRPRLRKDPSAGEKAEAEDGHPVLKRRDLVE
ncbi:MAG: M48 family metallopeptidase [Bryobacteraceae bacterium]